SATGSVAVGAGAVAALGGAAFGDGARANAGTAATALGPGAIASGSQSFAGASGATASGANSTALGSGALALGDSAMALGAGAQATKLDQIVVGTTANIYTTPGLTSAASIAAQSGPLSLVITDASGNLASLLVSNLPVPLSTPCEELFAGAL